MRRVCHQLIGEGEFSSVKHIILGVFVYYNMNLLSPQLNRLRGASCQLVTYSVSYIFWNFSKPEKCKI
jgi:hypothetical protein